ncbi:MAG: hypothetical protein HC903_10015 [Methylacidiphilales bacterium]|nr:hypothetical protein [Candidatus Methylacidiphilales bacterium]NJR17096.1 hypothetical protein [Calothrix sp. CSU_2_0]
MYREREETPAIAEKFSLSFEGKLSPTNRWVVESQFFVGWVKRSVTKNFHIYDK